uniref:Uncharacterized protein n=1 Tax=Asparagus officinalis TaxID=4686 RepID=Q2AAA6_ASPOF|nr:hypothetical protein 17.t00009 [Asparagus officinalis]
MQLLRQSDDSLLELEHEVLEKKQKVKELGEVSEKLSSENKKVVDIERNQQRLVESYRVALVDIQAKLSKAENELKSATERRQTLATQQEEHQTLLQAESDDLERLSNAISNVKVPSDDDLRKKAMDEFHGPTKALILLLTSINNYFKGVASLYNSSTFYWNEEDADPMLRACGISISTQFTQADGWVLLTPKLKVGH